MKEEKKEEKAQKEIEEKEDEAGAKGGEINKEDLKWKVIEEFIEISGLKILKVMQEEKEKALISLH